MCAIKIAKQKGMTMTTNFEWLYENDRETLIIMTSGDCDKCKYDSDCAKAFCRCERKWLEAEYEEYVEPDSWEKITNDALLNPEEYCVENGIHYYDREEAEMLKASSLVFRCKDMCDLLMKEE